MDGALAGPGTVDVENEQWRIHNPLDVTDVAPTPLLIAALGPVMLRIAGELRAVAAFANCSRIVARFTEGTNGSTVAPAARQSAMARSNTARDSAVICARGT